MAGSTFCAVPVLPAGAVAFENGFAAGAVQHDALEHLAHLGCGYRRNYARAFGGLEGDGLRTILWSDGSGDNARGNTNTVVGDGRNQRRELHCGDADFLAHGDGGEGNLGPAIYGLGHAARFAGEFNAGLLAESESANVFVKAIVAEAHSDFDGAHIAGFGDDVGDGEPAVGPAVANAHAVDDDGAHLAVEHFLGGGDFFFEASGDGDHFEG